MTVFRGLAVCLTLLLWSLPAAAQDNPILQRMQAFAKAYNAKDAQAISTFYTKDGALLPPQSKPLIGHQPIADHYANAFKAGASNLTFRVQEITQAGSETAIEIGETEVHLGNQKIYGRYMHIWKNVGGAWLLRRDMYHVLGAKKR